MHFRNKAMYIKKIGLLSLAKFQAIFFLIFSFIAGFIFAFITTLFASDFYADFPMLKDFASSIWILSIIIFPLIAAAAGFVMGIIEALIYNLLSRFIKGFYI